MIVSLLQFDMAWQDVSANLSRAERMLRAADADLIVLPEMFATGFVTEPQTVAEPMTGTIAGWMIRIAREKNAAVTGSAIIEEQGNYFNRMLFAHPTGEVEHSDKRHLFSMGGEEEHFTCGGERKVVEYNGFRFLLQVCYDLRFPVWSRRTPLGNGELRIENGELRGENGEPTKERSQLRIENGELRGENGEPTKERSQLRIENGKLKNNIQLSTFNFQLDYDVVLYAASWPESRRDIWRTLLRARAIENQAYVLGANRTGTDPRLSYVGDSAVIDPKGKTLAEAGAEETLVTATLDLAELRAFREKFPVWRDADLFEMNNEKLTMKP